MPETVSESLAGRGSAVLDPVGPDGMVKALAVVFEKAADWEEAERLYRGVQEELDLPAPAISIAARGGYQVWFSLAEAVPAKQARDFLDGIRLRFLADLPPARLQFRPETSGERGFIELAPALHEGSGKWSAFIDPAMGSMFADEPGLEMAPSPDRQADLLAGCESIKPGDFLKVLSILQPPGGQGEAAPALRDEAPARRSPGLTVGSNFSDPRSFLLAVMNDPSASAGQRIKAAKALLPYFEKKLPK